MASNTVKIIIAAKNLASKTLGMVSNGVKRLSSVAKSMGRVAGRGFRILRNGIIAASAAMVAMVKHANEFRQQMALVSTMLPMGSDHMRKFTKSVIRLSAELGIAKSTLADGLYQALSAGVPPENALTFLTTAAKAAVGGATDVKTAVDGLTTIMNAYSISAEHASEVSDIMFAIVRDGKTTYGELADNISKVAPLAKVAGITLRELGATIAALVKVEKPERAMTALTAAMTVAAQRGQTLFELLDEFKGVDFEGIIGAGISKRAAAGVALLAGNMDVLNREMERFQDTGGAAEEAFRHMDNVRFWQKAWQSLLAIVTEFGIVLDKAIQPRIKAIAARISDLRDAAEGLAKALSGSGTARQLIGQSLLDAMISAFKIGGMHIANILHRTLFSVLKELPGLGHLEAFADPGADPFRKRDFDIEKRRIQGAANTIKKIGEIWKDSGEDVLAAELANTEAEKKAKIAAAKEVEMERIAGIDFIAKKEADLAKANAKEQEAADRKAHDEKLAALNDEIARAKQAFDNAQQVINQPFNEFAQERQQGLDDAKAESDRLDRLDKLRKKQAKRGLTLSREDQAILDMANAFDEGKIIAQQIQNKADADGIKFEAELKALNKAAVERDKKKTKALENIEKNMDTLLRAPGGF